MAKMGKCSVPCGPKGKTQFAGPGPKKGTDFKGPGTGKGYGGQKG